MVVRHGRPLWGIVFLLVAVILGASQEVLQLLDLLLGKILIQWSEEVNCIGGVIIFGSGIQLVSGATQKEVGPEGTVLLNLLGNFDSGIDFTGVAVVSDCKVLLLQYQNTIRGFELGNDDRWSNIDTEINSAIGRPDWGDEIGESTVLGIFARMRAVGESRDPTGVFTRRGSILASHELVDTELNQQEDSESLEGTLEARLKIESVNQRCGT